MKVTTIRSRFRIKRRSYNQLLFLSVLAISYFSGVSAAPSGTEYEVCQSEKCRELADELLSGMNETINPCDDFYGYVCGNWAETHPIPGEYLSWSYTDIIINKTNNRLRDILESVPIDGESTSIRKAKQLYRSCMDTNAIESEGVTVLMKYINETGGWPIIMSPGEWENSRKPWQSVESEYSAIMGTSNIVKLDVDPYDDNLSHINILIVEPPSFENLPPPPNSSNLDEFFTKPLTANHIKFIKEIAGIMARARGRSVLDDNQVEQDARGIILFESYLASISSYPIDEDQVTEVEDEEFDIGRLYPDTTIAVFQEFYDSSAPKTPTGKIDWLKRIQEFFAQNQTNSMINSSEKIIFYGNENYFKLLSGLLDRTPERDIVNTIQWWFVKHSLNYLNQDMIEIFEKYSKGDFPVVDNQRLSPLSQSRSLRCVVENRLEHALAFRYVQIYFRESTRAAILDIFNELKLEMRKEISQSKWLDMESKNATMEKLAKMAIIIGYPDWYKNRTVLDERYEGLSIGSSYFENVLLVNRFILQKKLKLLGKPIDKTIWTLSPVSVNAYHGSNLNAVVFPAGFLQMPFFDTELPEALNYGKIGVYISHEMMHGFDSRGSLYDKDGHFTDIWSDDTTRKFRNRSQCLMDQFNKNGGNGYLTVDENIADSAGIRTAFETLKTHMNNSHNSDVRLPGLQSFSVEKLYFMVYAGSMCEYVTPEYRALVNADVHSPAHLRVRGSLSNYEGFSETFECPEGSRMNPSEKCSFWQ